jgi:hypothetical protein
MNFSISNLNLYVFAGRSDQAEIKSIYEEVYSKWKSIWKSTFLELDGTAELHSDSFTRQDKIVAVFYKNECVSFAGLRSYNLDLSASVEDSIFSAWPHSCLKQLSSEGKNVLVCSNLGVNPAFRGPLKMGASLKNLNIYACVRILLEDGFDAMAGTTRFNKGVHTAAYSNGAVLLGKSTMHGVAVDLVGFYRKQIEKNIDQLNQLYGEQIWNSRVDYTKQFKINRQILEVA